MDSIQKITFSLKNFLPTPEKTLRKSRLDLSPCIALERLTIHEDDQLIIYNSERFDNLKCEMEIGDFFTKNDQK